MSPRFEAATTLRKKPGECFPVGFPTERPRGHALNGFSGRHSSRGVFLILVAAILLFSPASASIANNNGHQETGGTPYPGPSHPESGTVPGAPALPSESAEIIVHGQKTGTTDPEPVGGAGNLTLPFIAGNATPGSISRHYTFPFQKSNITVTTMVSNAAYYGAKNGDKFAIISQETAPETLAADYYRAFVNDPHQDQFYTSLIQSFRSIRTDHNYSDDEYLELLTVFVQSLPYDNESAVHPGNPSRFPVETIVEGTGDCDDKSVLLAGFLSREGFNVSLLLFIPEHHMAVGIAGDRMQYRNSGYMYVETTGVSFMGDVPPALNQSVKYVPFGQLPRTTPITSIPVVIRVGSGSKRFTRADEAEYILLQKKEVDARIALLRVHLNTTSRDSPPYRTLMENYYTYTGIHNYIVKHEQDRAGTYRYLTTQLPPAFSSVSPADNPPCPNSLAGDENGQVWYLPCPRGIWVPQRCVWQSERQEFITPCS
jgi:hypothetical protein